MRHDIVIEGVGFRLRPIEIEDAAFVLELRTDPVRARLLHATSPKLEDQIAWTQKYFERAGDWYFIVESLKGEPHGAVAIYNHNENKNEAEWGRWIIKNGSLAAVECASLIYDTGFDVLDLKEMYTHTEEENEPVVSFHTSLGSTEHGLVTGPEGERWIEQRMTRDLWSEKRPLLESKISMAARLASR